MAEMNHNTSFDDELLSAYIDGELTDAERTEVEARLENDPAARELVAEMRSLSGTLRSLPRLSSNEDVREAVLDQVRDKQASLPAYRLSPMRRLLWPAVAIAAAILLIFTQGESQENRELARVDEETVEATARDGAGRSEMAFDASGPAMAPLAEEARERAVAVESPPPVSLGVPVESAVEPSPTSGTPARAAADTDLGIVHLTLTDFRSGAERFDRLLASNGVQLLGDSAEERRFAASGRGGGVGGVPAAGTMSTRATVPSVATGSAPSSAESTTIEPSRSEPEMVLVEAPPKQIEQILFACNNDTETIKDVTIDPSASGLNRAPARQRLYGYQQYARGSKAKTEVADSYAITPEQQGVIAVLNSLPTPDQDSEPAPEEAEQGWATKLRANESLADRAQLENEVNQRRSLYFQNTRQQQALNLDKKIAKQRAAVEQPMRVLFLLHPSENAAKK